MWRQKEEKKELEFVCAVCAVETDIKRHDSMTPQCADEIQPGSLNPPGHDNTLSASTPHCWVRMYETSYSANQR